MIEPVANVITDLGTDITPLVSQQVESQRCSARGLVALFIAESNLCECARRPTDPSDDLAYWMDVSGGLGQQTVYYAKGYGLGDGTSSPENIAEVMTALFNPSIAIPIAADQYGSYYRATGDHFEACARYNGGPAATFADLPAENQANYTRAWAASARYAMPAPVSTATYNPDSPAERQAAPWNCSCATGAWMLQSIGQDVTEAEVTSEMVAQGLVSPELGLLDGSGAGLAAYLGARSGLPAHSAWFAANDADWAWLQAHAGQGPIGLGSGTLYHWLAIRKVQDATALAGMNPSPEYQSVGDEISRADYIQWAPWAGVWLDVAPAEDGMTEEEAAHMAALEKRVTELETQVAYLTHDVASAIQSSHDDMVRFYYSQAPPPSNATNFQAAADAQQAAIDTLKRGG